MGSGQKNSGMIHPVLETFVILLPVQQNVLQVQDTPPHWVIYVPFDQTILEDSK